MQKEDFSVHTEYTSSGCSFLPTAISSRPGLRQSLFCDRQPGSTKQRTVLLNSMPPYCMPKYASYKVMSSFLPIPCSLFVQEQHHPSAYVLSKSMIQNSTGRVPIQVSFFTSTIPFPFSGAHKTHWLDRIASSIS